MSELNFPSLENSSNFLPYYRHLVNLKKQDGYNNWPQEVKDAIDKALKLSDARNNYVETTCSPPGKELAKIIEISHTANWENLHKTGKTKNMMVTGMMTGCGEGLFLKFLVSMQRAKYVLDIGMFTGYSALSMAEALPADGKVFTCDCEQYLADINRKVFDSSPHGKKIEIRLGNAVDTLNALAADGIQIDFAFIDADKVNYGVYFDLLLDKNILAPRGTIAVDNSLWFGRSYLLPDDTMANFNRKIMADSRVQRVLLPIRDGIMLIRRNEDLNSET